jgi:hypothetical protein
MWSSRPAWNEVHRLTAAFAATLASMAVPYLTISTWPRVDIVGKVIFDVLALIGFLILARKVLARANVATTPLHS